MPVVTKEVEETKTFKQASAPVKEYHYMKLSIGPAALPDGTVTGDMADMEVMYWLNSGYRLLSVASLGAHKGPGGEFYGDQYGYHFVKDLS